MLFFRPFLLASLAFLAFLSALFLASLAFLAAFFLAFLSASLAFLALFARAFLAFLSARLAFLSAFSRELVVQDIVRGKVLRRINLKGVVEEGDEDGDFLVALPGDRLAIVLGGRQLGDIVLFGKGGGAPESRHTAPRCPKAPTVE